MRRFIPSTQRYYRSSMVLQVMFPCACCFIVCWFPLSFTTCFDLHGHLQVCRILYIYYFDIFKDSASLPFFFTWSHSACFPFVFCFCAVFLRVFFFVFLLMRMSTCTSGKYAECEHVKKRQRTKKKATKQNP
jgi:hypothetical protein